MTQLPDGKLSLAEIAEREQNDQLKDYVSLLEFVLFKVNPELRGNDGKDPTVSQRIQSYKRFAGRQRKIRKAIIVRNNLSHARCRNVDTSKEEACRTLRWAVEAASQDLPHDLKQAIIGQRPKTSPSARPVQSPSTLAASRIEVPTQPRAQHKTPVFNFSPLLVAAAIVLGLVAFKRMASVSQGGGESSGNDHAQVDGGESTPELLRRLATSHATQSATMAKRLYARDLQWPSSRSAEIAVERMKLQVEYATPDELAMLAATLGEIGPFASHASLALCQRLKPDLPSEIGATLASAVLRMGVPRSDELEALPVEFHAQGLEPWGRILAATNERRHTSRFVQHNIEVVREALSGSQGETAAMAALMNLRVLGPRLAEFKPELTRLLRVPSRVTERRAGTKIKSGVCIVMGCTGAMNLTDEQFLAQRGHRDDLFGASLWALANSPGKYHEANVPRLIRFLRPLLSAKNSQAHKGLWPGYTVGIKNESAEPISFSRFGARQGMRAKPMSILELAALASAKLEGAGLPLLSDLEQTVKSQIMDSERAALVQAILSIRPASITNREVQLYVQQLDIRWEPQLTELDSIPESVVQLINGPWGPGSAKVSFSKYLGDQMSHASDREAALIIRLLSSVDRQTLMNYSDTAKGMLATALSTGNQQQRYELLQLLARLNMPRLLPHESLVENLGNEAWEIRALAAELLSQTRSSGGVARNLAGQSK